MKIKETEIKDRILSLAAAQWQLFRKLERLEEKFRAATAAAGLPSGERYTLAESAKTIAQGIGSLSFLFEEEKDNAEA